jgi:hypothetical protein
VKSICVLVVVLLAGTAQADPRCVESTDVHGYRECKRFGRWGRARVPAPFLEVGAALRMLSDAEDTATVATVRAGIIHHGTWLAIEGELGGLANTVAGPGARIAEGTTTVASGVGVIGKRYRYGVLAVGAEAAAGVRTLSYQLESQTEGILEGRGRADVWLTPYLSIGASYGRSFVDSGWLAGVNVNWNARPFGY